MRTKPSVMQDYLQLTKPRISMLCLLMFIGGYGYAAFLRGAPAANSYAEALGWLKFVFGMVGTWAAVASANVLNMVVERESDSLMRRTAGRPIPEGRLPWTHAAIFGVALGILSGALLAFVNFGTFCLGMIALLGYVLIYTPLKRVTPQALIIGAVPGAMPPLMGWTSHQGGVDAVGLTLFGILLIWQVPHFMAIAIVHREDYMRAGIKVLPAVATERRAILEALVYSVALLAVSLALVPLAGAGAIYAVAAAGLGLWLIQLLWRGRHGMSTAQARGIFFASLVYLPALALALALDGAVVTWLGGPSLLPFSALP
jgi:protoheme IX farnesyltransferase